MTTQLAVNFMKESELIKRVAKSRNLILSGKHREHSSCLEFDSDIIGTFNLDDGFVSALQNHSFSFGPSTDSTRDGMIYLSGNSDQRGKEVFESDCWSWKGTKTDLQLTISFRLLVAEEKRGVVCTPHVWGNCSGGACHIPTINNFVRVVAEHFPGTHPLIREAVNGNFQPVIFWGNINMAGVKSIGLLFYEVYGQNRKVDALARSSLSPFDPNPYPPYSFFEVADRSFVPESDQPRLSRQWKEQLESFKDGLV